jgi:glyoxylase I family protein
MPNSSQELAAHLIQLEQQLLQPSTRCDEVALRSLLAEDFREFGSSGRVYTRQQVISALAGEASHTFTLSDPLCRQLAADIALLTYHSTRATAPGVASMRYAAPSGFTATAAGR